VIFCPFWADSLFSNKEVNKLDSNEIQFENYQFFINHQIIEQYPLLKPFVYQLLNNDDSTYKEKLIQKLIMCNFKNSFNIEDCYFKVRFILFYECEIDCPKIPLLSTFLRDELDLYYYVKKYKFSLNTYGPFFYENPAGTLSNSLER